MNFDFDAEKNELLFRERDVTFQNVIDAIKEKGVLADFKHPNMEKYPNQRIFVVELNNYTYCIPYIENEETVFMKTIFPNRKFLKLLENKND
ncbi:toxin [Candidatus Magnetomorum sp. HK-1]|nr:toxin [Candidatus Magnetomorum sp. HK-1]